MTDQVTLQARTGAAVRLRRGQRLTIVNTHGTQVVDCWALNAADPGEHMSMPHCRNQWYRLTPRPDDLLVTNLRNPILRLVADSSPGIHDTLIPCCDLTRYHQLGIKGHHASCAENFTTALRTIDIEQMLPPPPLNLFMLNNYLPTVFGWRINVDAGTNPRCLRNFPMRPRGLQPV